MVWQKWEAVSGHEHPQVGEFCNQTSAPPPDSGEGIQRRAKRFSMSTSTSHGPPPHKLHSREDATPLVPGNMIHLSGANIPHAAFGDLCCTMSTRSFFVHEFSTHGSAVIVGGPASRRFKPDMA